MGVLLLVGSAASRGGRLSSVRVPFGAVCIDFLGFEHFSWARKEDLNWARVKQQFLATFDKSGVTEKSLWQLCAELLGR